MRHWITSFQLLRGAINLEARRDSRKEATAAGRIFSENRGESA